MMEDKKINTEEKCYKIRNMLVVAIEEDMKEEEETEVETEAVVMIIIKAAAEVAMKSIEEELPTV